MKILYLNNQFYLHGGIEKILSDKINYFIQEFHYDVTLCTSEHKDNAYVYPLDEKINHVDLEINYDRSKSYFHPTNLKKSVTHYKRLKQLIKTLQPDVVISVNYTPEQYFLPFIEKHIPKVKEFHSSGVTLKAPIGFVGKLKYQLFKLFGRYDCAVVLNASETAYYPFDNIAVIPNFIQLPLQKEPCTKEKIIIAAGRIAAVKQFDHLIKAWHKIALQFPDWKVEIYGDGDEELSKALNNLIVDLQVPNINLMGATRDLKHKMNTASVYAMISATECFPMVLLEAQAAQMAIVSYDCPNGPRHIVEDIVTGVLSPYNDIERFAATLEELLIDDNRRLRLGQQAAEQVKQFSAPEVMHVWNKLFKDLKR